MSEGERFSVSLSGMFHDVLYGPAGQVQWDGGWRKNTIVENARLLLAQLVGGMGALGIQGLQIGAGSPAWDSVFQPPSSSDTTLTDPNPFTVLRANLQFAYVQPDGTVSANPTNRLQVARGRRPRGPALARCQPPDAHAARVRIGGPTGRRRDARPHQLRAAPGDRQGPRQYARPHDLADFLTRSETMAVITNNTFDPSRQYTSVRLQQGVPLVDADWNEGQDALKFAIQVLARWFVGDGVPAGTDGFHIEGTGLANDFIIRAGITGTADVLGNAGRLIVGGWDAFILADINFTAQPLHASQGASATALAAQLGVPVIAALTTPAANGEALVYVDVWEHLVMPTDDTSLLLPGLGGTESSRAHSPRVGGACARRSQPAAAIRRPAALPARPPIRGAGPRRAALGRQ